MFVCAPKLPCHRYIVRPTHAYTHAVAKFTFRQSNKSSFDTLHWVQATATGRKNPFKKKNVFCHRHSSNIAHPSLFAADERITPSQDVATYISCVSISTSSSCDIFISLSLTYLHWTRGSVRFSSQQVVLFLILRRNRIRHIISHSDNTHRCDQFLYNDEMILPPLASRTSLLPVVVNFSSHARIRRDQFIKWK